LKHFRLIQIDAFCSVGLDDVEDLVSDLQQALDLVTKSDYRDKK